MWDNAKRRAKKHNLPFTIEVNDIIIPKMCPVLGIPLYHDIDGRSGSRIHNSPTLDRVLPKLGYIRGNILVVSRLANQIKSEATVDQIGKVFAYYSELERNLIKQLQQQ